MSSEISAFMSLVSEIDAKLESENTDNNEVKKYNFYGIHSPLAKALCDLLTKGRKQYIQSAAIRCFYKSKVV